MAKTSTAEQVRTAIGKLTHRTHEDPGTHSPRVLDPDFEDRLFEVFEIFAKAIGAELDARLGTAKAKPKSTSRKRA